ncbi:MAG: tRNA pseudouridine(55) synthase TruB [Sphingobacterium sp.]|jgi:tRNA pseudouridine55 synthase|uniref:tRNA pseudouridine(55) synthase TruB n=1 Tax=unclassified Sphingobacterium TaxID=2609468 RepID=UPI0009861B00|nr:tRNA pseudouridine(55) synthase TruB [Sphingobacterium sp. CZ-UAM]MDF2517478.1 tRNA pseudouridine(55) synthase TruB [Sphingobacterium sp.]OOG20079.1 tRNA pseudouridine(55) synthase TruB [Sphingobacterium sp. CZ-UAM]
MENNEVGESSARFNFADGEMLLIDKPLTWTSFDVVGKVRNSLKPLKLKVGHAGTLDPLATGLLIVCTGKLTKKIDAYQAEDKEYTGTITLGGTTPSYDLETEIDETFPIDHITEQMIFDAAKTFEGDIQQFPPAHSAIKINGERVYEKARRGEEVEIKSRQVRINSFEIEKIELPNVYFRISCSKGTYIRSLAYDFGKVLHSGSHLSSLRRTKSGDYHVENAWNLEQLIAEIKRHKEIIK